MKIRRSPGTRMCLKIRALMAVVLLFLFLPSCASRGRISSFYLDPADGDRAVFNHAGLTLWAVYLDKDEQTQYLIANEREDLAREIGDLPLSAFLLGIVNKSTTVVIVDPASIRFATGSGPLMSPLSYAHLYMLLPRNEERLSALQGLQGVVLDRPVAVSPGGREEGLVFFQRPEKVTRDVVLALDGVYFGGAQQKAVLAFKAVPVEK